MSSWNCLPSVVSECPVHKWLLTKDVLFPVADLSNRSLCIFLWYAVLFQQLNKGIGVWECFLFVFSSSNNRTIFVLQLNTNISYNPLLDFYLFWQSKIYIYFFRNETWKKHKRLKLQSKLNLQRWWIWVQPVVFCRWGSCPSHLWCHFLLKAQHLECNFSKLYATGVYHSRLKTYLLVISCWRVTWKGWFSAFQ